MFGIGEGHEVLNRRFDSSLLDPQQDLLNFSFGRGAGQLFVSCEVRFGVLERAVPTGNLSGEEPNRGFVWPQAGALREPFARRRKVVLVEKCLRR